jgi:hypothetical protein
VRKRAVHRHGLRGIFYTAGDTETSVGAQRIVGGAVGAGAAANALGAPIHDFVEQAHAAAVGNSALDPLPV